MAERISRYGSVTRALVGASATLALVVGLAASGLTIRYLSLRSVGAGDPLGTIVPSGAPAPTGPCGGGACTYLLLGSDSRANLSPEEQERFGTDESLGGEQRADTIMLVHTDPDLEKAIVLSFPRDLWVQIPGRGFDRINAAFEGGLTEGGARRMAQTVANLTGLRIDHYVYVDLEGFRRTVETLGGVRMCIPSYNVNTPGWLPATGPDGQPTQVYVGAEGHIADPNSGLDILPGCQLLRGDQALAYVRARHLPCDHVPDFARIGRQQQFLRAVINRMLEPGMLVRAPGFVEPVLENLRRDAELLPSDLVHLVGQLRGMSTGAVEFRTVPGVAALIDDKAVLRMDPSARQIFRAIRDGRPIGAVGTQLVNTPPSEATTRVAVIDANSGGAATEVAAMLADAGFDVSPGVWSPSEAPADVTGPSIVHRPGAAANAQVVAAYLPGIQLVPSDDLRGAQVAIVVPASYRPASSGEGRSDGSNGCPAP
jgi:anionic cell wall polymer biosynthesis LytR-Cps2A-Psr (LCP) family protein